jgi:hypothetical protein
MRRAARKLGVLAAIAIAASCQTVKDPLPPQAALNVDITDSAVATQVSPLPAPQIASWKVDELSASGITGFEGTFSFLYSGACFYQLNAAAPVSFAAACRTSGLTLAPNSGVLTAAIRISISRLELRAAARPDLSPTADPDGDGVPNSTDNCPIVFNPDQANFNVNGEILKNGDACSDVDNSGHPTIPDQDLDGVSDFLDNCLWYPSPAATLGSRPPDTDNDGIGDACERVAPVVLPNGRLTLECDNVTFNAQSSKVAFFRLDFGQPGVLTCDAGFTGCTLDPSALKLSLAGTSATFDCFQVP